MHKAPILESKQIEHVLNERRILEEASSHPFCVGLVRAYQDKPCLYLLQEWVGGQCPSTAPLLPFHCLLIALCSAPLLPFQCPLAVPPSSPPLQHPDAPPPPSFLPDNASHTALLACTLLVLLQQPGCPLPQPALGERSVFFVSSHWFKSV